MKERNERRLAENEIIFKQINKDVEGFLQDVGVENLVLAPFYCECADLGCHERIELMPAEYERIHKNPKRFIVLKGHEVPTIESVIERRDKYNVVEKFAPMPGLNELGRRLKEL
jgi:hypothetical protein